MNTREWTLLTALAVLWGGSFFFAKVAVAEVPPLTLVLARVAIAALACWCCCAPAASPCRWTGRAADASW